MVVVVVVVVVAAVVVGPPSVREVVQGRPPVILRNLRHRSSLGRRLCRNHILSLPPETSRSLQKTVDTMSDAI